MLNMASLKQLNLEQRHTIRWFILLDGNIPNRFIVDLSVSVASSD